MLISVSALEADVVVPLVPLKEDGRPSLDLHADQAWPRHTCSSGPRGQIVASLCLHVGENTAWEGAALGQQAARHRRAFVGRTLPS